MAKGNGSTKSTGASGASATRTLATSLSKAQIEERVGISERRFFNTTGIKYGHPLSSYEEHLSILNRLPDSAVLFTGHRAEEAKDYLKKLIRVIS